MARRPYDDPRWKPLRLAMLDRDGHQCRIRLAGCQGKATMVDHILGWQQGGAWFDPTNLQAACRSCNTAKRYRGDRPEATSPRTWT